MKKVISSALAALLMASSSNSCVNQLCAVKKDTMIPKDETITKCYLKIAKDILSVAVPVFVFTSIFGKPVENSNQKNSPQENDKNDLSIKTIYGKYNLPVLSISKEDFINPHAQSTDPYQRQCIQNANYMQTEYENSSLTCVDPAEIKYINVQKLSKEQPVSIIECKGKYYIPIGHSDLFFDNQDSVPKEDKIPCILNFDNTQSDQVFDNISTCAANPCEDELANTGVVSLLRLRKYNPHVTCRIEQLVKYLERTQN